MITGRNIVSYYTEMPIIRMVDVTIIFIISIIIGFYKFRKFLLKQKENHITVLKRKKLIINTIL